MEQEREESEFLGDCEEPLVESAETQTLAGEDANAVEVSDSGVCGVSETVDGGLASGGGSLKAGDSNTVNSVSDEKQVKADDVVETHDIAEETKDEVEKTVSSDDVEMKDETAKNGASHETAGKDKTVTSAGNGATDGSETKDAKHSESEEVPEMSTQLSKKETDEGNRGSTVPEVGSAAELCPEEEITNVNQEEEENGEAMEIDEEQVGKDVTVGDAVNESSGATAVQTALPIAEADKNDSNVVKGMEIDEQKDNAGVASTLAKTVESSDSANPNNPTGAAGEVETLDHNALFDPRSDIANFIDFTDSGNVSLKEDKKESDIAEEVPTERSSHKLSLSAEGVANESNETHVATDCPKEVSDAIMGSEETQDETAHEAPSIDPNQKEGTEMEEDRNNSDSDVKTNGVKRKADVLGEESPGEEGRKTVSLAKVSFAERPSFKIGACIARAASQMAGTPSVLKGGNFGDETLSVESFVSQLHSAATDPVKENVVSEIATGFFLDFRNSSASHQVTPENVPRKRGRPSNANAGGTEAFEFEEMGDTYWTDRVIHNGGEEQTPPAAKENYQVVPVELKPAQVQRTRRPYRRRQSHISLPLPSALDKQPDFDENAPAELRMNFSETDTIPPEKSLSKMFRHFGPIKESQTEVDEEKHRARVVFRKGADAEVAYNSAGKFSIFGTKTVTYELSRTITETFKVQPYVVSLGEEEAGLSVV